MCILCYVTKVRGGRENELILLMTERAVGTIATVAAARPKLTHWGFGSGAMRAAMRAMLLLGLCWRAY